MVKIARATLHDLQKYFFYAGVISVTMFGCYIALACVTIRQFHRAKHLRPALVRRTEAYIIVVALAFGVYVVSTLTQIYQLLLPVKHRSDWTTSGWIVGTYISLSTMSLMGDSLFVYRCWIIWQHSRAIWAFFALLGVDAVVLITSAVLDGMDGASAALRVRSWREKMSVVGISVSVALNVLLAGAAITRLLLARRDLRREALPYGGGHYVRLCGLLSVSTVIYTGGWLFVLVVRSDLSVLYALSVQVGVLAATPLLIMLHATRREEGVLNAASIPLSLPPVSDLSACEANRPGTLSCSRPTSMRVCRPPLDKLQGSTPDGTQRRSWTGVDYSTAAGCSPDRRESILRAGVPDSSLTR